MIEKEKERRSLQEPHLLLISPRKGATIYMIRQFSVICKSIIRKFSCEQSFNEAVRRFNHYSSDCPACHARRSLKLLSSYERNLVSLRNESVVELRIIIPRYICSSCGTTHALIPDSLVPYSPYSLFFMVTVLSAYFERSTTVSDICSHYGIAVSTLYKWKDTLIQHKALLLGVLTSITKTPGAFIRELLHGIVLTADMIAFFRTHSFSFMQPSRQLRHRFPSPK